jgi:uncharacterized protein
MGDNVGAAPRGSPHDGAQPARRLTRRACLAALAAGGALLLGAPMLLYHHERRLTVEQVAIPPQAGDAEPGLTVALLSDLHIKGQGDAQALARAVETVNALAPDLIVLAGDYVWRYASSITLATPVLAQLRAPLGVWAVLGNHDLWTDRDTVIAGLQEAGVRVLVNQGQPLTLGGASIYLAGLDDGMVGAPDLEQALAGHDGRAPVVLLFHEPDLGHEMVAQGKVWLHLAGHSHGGQVRLPGRGALILPPYAHRYDMGLYPVGPGWTYVNRGLGTTSVPLRLNCPPEITLLHLHPPIA